MGNGILYNYSSGKSVVGNGSGIVRVVKRCREGGALNFELGENSLRSRTIL